MQFKTIAGTVMLATAGLLAFSAAQAEDFRTQLQLSHDTLDPDASGVDSSKALTFNATYYLEDVVTDGMPVPEAAFVTRKSYVNAVVTHWNGGTDGETYAANLGYHVPGTILFGRIGVVRQDLTGAGRDTQLNGTLGLVPVTGLMLSTDLQDGGYDANLTARYAGKLPNGRWFSTSVSASDPDVGKRIVGVQADYYLDGIALGGGYTSDQSRWNVRIDKGLPSGFGLLVRYFSDDLGKGFGVMLTWRDL